MEQCRVAALQERARLLEIGVVSTHVHVLVRAHPTTSTPRLVQRLKGSTSRMCAIRWAQGYNVESVSVRAVPVVVEYLRTQAEHHPAERIQGWPPEG